MAWTLCTSGSAVAKAGANANSTITASGSALAVWSDEAESYVSSLARVDLVSNYGNLTANGKQILNELTSSLIAEKIIMYDMSGYTSRGEASMMLNVIENNIVRNISLIKEDKIKTYLGAT